MNKILHKYQYCLLILLHFVSFQTIAQERNIITYPFYSTGDSSEIFALVREGTSLLGAHTDSAMVLFKKAEQLSHDAHFDDGIGYALAFMGLTETKRGNYKQGFTYYKKALPYCLNATQSKFVIAYLYMNMGISWKSKGDYLKANEYFHKALHAFQQYIPGNYSLIAVYINLIGIQARMGSYTEALHYADKAIQMAKDKQKKHYLALAILNKGNTYYTMELPDSAMQYYRKGLKVAHELKKNDLYQSYYLNIGNALLKKNENQKAITYFQKVIAFPNTGSEPLFSYILPRYSLGLAWYHLKHYKKAEKVLLEGLAKAEETGLAENEQDGHGVLASVYEGMGRYKEAMQQAAIYLKLKDSVTNMEKIRAINEIEVKYQAAKKNKEIAQKELKITQQNKKIIEKNIIIYAIFGGTALFMVLGFFVYRYQQKISRRELKIDQLKAIMAGEEKERARISRELHDGLGGMLTGIKMNLRTLQKQEEQTKFPENLDGIMNMLHGMGAEIHKTAHNLMPDILLKHDLQQALQLYCGQLNTGELQLNLQYYGTLRIPDKSLELSLYRIVQELIQNIIKHANATRAAIQIRQNETILCISAEDNGIGFNPKDNHNGLGLQNIEIRVKALNGYYALSSVPGRGTTSYIEIDFKKIKQHG